MFGLAYDRWGKVFALILLVAALTLGVFGCTEQEGSAGNVNNGANVSATSTVGDANSSTGNKAGQSTGSLTFRSYSLMKSHYEKHGKDMGFSSMEDYLAAANVVVSNPKSLHKTEKEDGDDVYYLEKTNDFVVVSTDGYIRTYFRPDSGKKYYDKQ